MTDLWPIPATTRTLGVRRPWKLQDFTTLGLCAVQLVIYTRICLIIIIIIIPGTVCDFVLMCFLIFALTLYGHTKTAEQQAIIQRYGDWYRTGRWLVGCYIWYSEEGPGRAAAPPSPLLAVRNVTAHSSTANWCTIIHCGTVIGSVL